MSDGQRGMEARRQLHERICKLHQDGATVQEIALRMGMTKGAVHYILKKAVGSLTKTSS